MRKLNCVNFMKNRVEKEEVEQEQFKFKENYYSSFIK